MNPRFCVPVLFACVLSAAVVMAQTVQDPQKEPPGKDFFKKGFGPGGPGFGGPMGQRRQLVAQFDTDGDGRLNNEERQAAREFLKKQPGGPGKDGFKGKGGFMPPDFFMRPLIEALDADKDGRLSRDEMKNGIKKFFADTAKDAKDSLTEEQLADGIGRLLPLPPGFGPPGGPPPGDKGGFGPKGPPGGRFGPGTALAHGIFERADADKDSKLTLKELLSAAETLFKEADRNADGLLDETELAAVVGRLMPMPEFGPPGGFGFPGGPGGKGREPGRPGPKVAPADVNSYSDKKLYDTGVLRTVFLEFENRTDFEAELADFYHTDVEVPATVIVDGKKYANVGVHFRGNSSYMMSPAGSKHSLNLSFDFVEKKQRLYGYKTLNLLNCAQDPTFMHSVLYCNLSRQYIPAPKANFIKVVINGESWGIFANQQQFNKEFLQENYKTTKGARWRVPGHPGAGGAGLSYLGENVQEYKRHYVIKSEDNAKDWKALVALCRTLDKTPLDKLEDALKPILDLDGVLWFLALDNAVINDDGYWTRASDYSLYRDPKGKFHVIAYDTNETFQPLGGGFGGPKGGPGMGKGPKDGGFGKGPKERPGGPYGLDPLSGLDDPRAPLRSRLLAVPSLRAKYLKNMHAIAGDSFDWAKLKPVVDQYRLLIEKEVELDTRKLSSLAEFRSALAEVPNSEGGGPGSRFNLRAFIDGRRAFLLNHPDVKKAGGE